MSGATVKEVQERRLWALHLAAKAEEVLYMSADDIPELREWLGQLPFVLSSLDEEEHSARKVAAL